ncbi:cupin domain-containing protein [Jeotgalibacillus proteolyticus]|uniref:Cupin domain-containing protein n=1 Tax=Jeotgalibacillus proteolyticus TaxID=2082395 RepID=A0A2S5GDU4_9BACL|nr:cupin domain-containing protein [Jeotgalibacillus proteolyticus]
MKSLHEEFAPGSVLTHPDGRTVRFIESGEDDGGRFIILEHRIKKPGPLNGPHWHPELKEIFKAEKGSMRFKVDGNDILLQAGEELTVHPKQVHQFSKTGEEELIVTHEIRPPGQHWKMFVLVHKLECEGKMSEKGILKNPLWLGIAWECIDGYLAGPPKLIQRIFLGGLARFAGRLGYRV